MVHHSTLSEFDGLDGYFQDLLLESPQADAFVEGLAKIAAATFSAPGIPVLCGVTLHRRKKSVTVASSDPRAKGLDELQNTFHEGPCLTAMNGPQYVVVPDVLRERRWPQYMGAAAKQGVRSILSAPLLMEEGNKAALNLYALRPGAFDGEDTGRAEAFAAHASRGMRLALRLTELQQARDDMAVAMQSRTAIDVATGVLMAQNHCSQDDAFLILRTASNNRNVKLRDLAVGITDAVSSRHGISTHFDE
jgi:GAF domain-containing protein